VLFGTPENDRNRKLALGVEIKSLTAGDGYNGALPRKTIGRKDQTSPNGTTGRATKKKAKTQEVKTKESKRVPPPFVGTPSPGKRTLYYYATKSQKNRGEHRVKNDGGKKRTRFQSAAKKEKSSKPSGDPAAREGLGKTN